MNAKRYRKQFSRNCSHYTYKVILLGDYGVGKTSLFRRLKGGMKQLQRLDSTLTARQHSISGLTTTVYQDTIDYCSRTFTMQDGKKVQVDFWDTGSVERYRGSLTRNYYKAATGIILMYNATDPTSLTSLRTWMEDAQTYTHNATFLLLGNKYDRSDLNFYQVDEDLSNAFALNNEIPLHFKISTEHSDDAALAKVFQSLTEHMHRKMEQSYTSTNTDCPLSCTMDTVALFADTHTRSSCCSKR